jgi:hypothetical protein
MNGVLQIFIEISQQSLLEMSQVPGFQYLASKMQVPSRFLTEFHTLVTKQSRVGKVEQTASIFGSYETNSLGHSRTRSM